MKEVKLDNAESWYDDLIDESLLYISDSLLKEIEISSSQDLIQSLDNDLNDDLEQIIVV